ncbi:hypothetical protein DSO57_1015562 [Entomophthora muscae]|uniref:Uncharacterized protein n=1 Tax=Entomophthora muscae TaxID=34485 RepID=A0ACC2RW70_9FUNG|nr:hypothetical protein DSO57_1015562 [Entomophthora muscae]
MHSDKDAMTPICARELYHGLYDASCLAAEVLLGLQSVSLAPGQISAQHAHCGGPGNQPPPTPTPNLLQS